MFASGCPAWRLEVNVGGHVPSREPRRASCGILKRDLTY
jgi:hypothetical protein